MSSRPRRLKVGAAFYSVAYSPSADHSSEDRLGECDYRNTEIQLWAQSQPSERNTLLHEALHAVLWDSGIRTMLDLDYDADEKLVRILTPWMLCLIRANPRLIDFLRA